MKIKSVIPLLVIIAGILLFPLNSFAAKKHYFDGLSGGWQGKGFITKSKGAKEEAIRCRLKNKIDKKSAKLLLSGNCGVGGVLIPMSGWIKQKGKSKKYTASLFKSLALLRIDSFAGRLSGKKLKLNFKGKDKVSNEAISAFVTIHSKSKSHFDILLSSTDPKSKKRFRVGMIKFSRK